MLTDYWVSRKYGSKSYGAANDMKFRRISKWGLKDRTKSQDLAGVSPAAAKLYSATELSSVLDQASLQAMPPVPGWMADIASGHTRMTDDKRVPEMFWFFLRRKMEQVRTHSTGWFSCSWPTTLEQNATGGALSPVTRVHRWTYSYV